jgi:hypothetical protein
MSGCRTFAAAVTAGTHFDYTIEGVTVVGEFETGHGVWDGTVLSRSAVLTSSNNNQLVNFSVGTKNVYVTVNSVTFSILDPLVCVDDFGCAGDGITDDTTAFQAALDTGAHFVYAPRTYLITRTLKLQKGQILGGPRRALLVNDPATLTDPRIIFRPGAPRQVCIKNIDSGGLGAVSGDGFGGYSSGVEDLAFDLNDATHTGIQFYKSYGNVCRRIWFYGTFNIGIMAHYTYVCNFEDIIMNGAAMNYGIYISEHTQAVNVQRLHTGGYSTDPSICSYGVAVNGGYSCTIANCIIQGPTIGIALRNVSGAVVDNPYFENTLCNMRIDNPCNGVSVRGGLWSAPYSYHQQYNHSGPIVLIYGQRIVFDAVNIQNTADNTTARGPWPFVFGDPAAADLQFNNPTHFAGTTRNLFYRDVGVTNRPKMTVVSSIETSGTGTEVIMMDIDGYGYHGIRVNTAGTISAVAYTIPTVFAAVDSLLTTALPAGDTLVCLS